MGNRMRRSKPAEKDEATYIGIPARLYCEVLRMTRVMKIVESMTVRARFRRMTTNL